MYFKFFCNSDKKTHCRRRHLKLHSACFRGSDVIDWLMANSTYTDRETARQTAREMLNQGILLSVAGSNQELDGAKRLYR